MGWRHVTDSLKCLSVTILYVFLLNIIRMVRIITK